MKVKCFRQPLRFALFGGGLCSGEIMEGGKWCSGGRGLVLMRGVAVGAQVGSLGCWALLEDGVVCGVFVCRGGVEHDGLGV